MGNAAMAKGEAGIFKAVLRLQGMTPSAKEVAWRRTTEPLYRYDDRPPESVLGGYFLPHEFVDAEVRRMGGEPRFRSVVKKAHLRRSAAARVRSRPAGG
jgi:hypothetical protein